MPAKCISSFQDVGIEFSDGTILWSYLPSDAQLIGSSEWPYEMRWKRIYKNYYFLTVYRNKRAVIFEHLVTEKDGLDVSPYLGESSVEKIIPKYGAVFWGDTIGVNTGERRPRLTLKIVEKEDLPPGFPMGLVRWIP